MHAKKFRVQRLKQDGSMDGRKMGKKPLFSIPTTKLPSGKSKLNAIKLNAARRLDEMTRRLDEREGKGEGGKQRQS